MPDTFLKLCDEVLRATKFISNYEECRPHFQQLLDYVVNHLNERDEMVKTLTKFVANGGYTEISLVQFLMESLKWPEIKLAAETRCAQEGNMYWEIKHLADVYNSAA